MTRALFRWLCLAWVAALFPVIMSAPLKVTVAVWAFLLTVAVVVPRGQRARRCAILYLLFLSFAAVDYIGVPIYGFVGGAPAGLAYYPADFWLVLGLVLAIGEGSCFVPSRSLRLLIFLGLAWTAAGIPSLFVAKWPAAAVQQWLAMPRAMVACVFVYSQARTEQARQQLALALLGGLLFQSCVAVAQHIWGTVLGLSWLGEARSEYLAKAIAPGIMLWRSGGAMGHPNVLATFLVGLIPVSFGVAVRRDVQWVVRVFSISTFLLACAALVWTYSRGAWISLFVVAAFISAVGLRWILGSRIVVPVVLLAVLVLAVMSPAIRQRVLHTESSATDVRFALIPVALRMAVRNPVHGVGLNNFAENIESFDPEMKLELFRHPVHNIVLLDLAEAGILAGILSGLLLGAIGMLAVVNIRHGVMKRRPLLAAVWSGCAAIVIHNMGDWTLRRPDILLLCWILIALGSSEAANGAQMRRD